MTADFSTVESVRYLWANDPDPRVRELGAEIFRLLCEWGEEPDPALRQIRRELIFSLEARIQELEGRCPE